MWLISKSTFLCRNQNAESLATEPSNKQSVGGRSHQATTRIEVDALEIVFENLEVKDIHLIPFIPVVFSMLREPLRSRPW